MTTPSIKEIIAAEQPAVETDEGLRLHAYLDTVGVPTIFYGHTGPEVHLGMTGTLEQAQAQLAADLNAHAYYLEHYLPWWRGLGIVRAGVLLNMAFNLGISGLLSFHNTLGAMKDGDYDIAAAMMIKSLWAKQVKGRATRLAEQMRTGVRA